MTHTSIVTNTAEAHTHWDNQILQDEEKILQFGLNLSQDEEKSSQEVLKNYQSAIKAQIIFAENNNNVEFASALKTRCVFITQFYILAKICSEDLNKDLIFSDFVKKTFESINELLPEKNDCHYLVNFIEQFTDLNQKITQNILLEDKEAKQVIAQINEKLNDPKIYAKDPLKKILNVFLSTNTEIKRLNSLQIEHKNQLPFLWQDLATPFASEYFLNDLTHNMQNSWQILHKKNDIFQRNNAAINHFQGTFIFLYGYMQCNLANFIWNERTKLVEKVYQTLHLKENIEEIDYKSWPAPEKFLITSVIIPIMQYYRKSFNTFNELIENKSLTNLSETINDYCKKNITSIKETVDILEELKDFIEQNPYKYKESTGPLIDLLNRWIANKSVIKKTPELDIEKLKTKVLFFDQNQVDDLHSNTQKRPVSYCTHPSSSPDPKPSVKNAAGFFPNQRGFDGESYSIEERSEAKKPKLSLSRST